MSKKFNTSNLKGMKPTCGIYAIIGPNGRRYIGKSVSAEKRLTHHLKTLTKNECRNIHLQRSWNKYGSENFEFEILIEVESKMLHEMECYFIDHYRKRKGVYNMMTPDRTNKGRIKHSSLTRNKMSSTKQIFWSNESHRIDHSEKLKQSAAKNRANGIIQSNNKSGVTGVVVMPNGTYRVDFLKHYLGIFKTKKEASEVRKQAEKDWQLSQGQACG